ncbi:MAG: reverse transcriptase family protein, partial [Sedimenticola sp.]
MTTLNVKNVETNRQYVEKLLTDTDVLCLQETWLFTYQLDQLNNISSKHSSHGKSVDENDPIPPLQKPRGYGGVATLTRNDTTIKYRDCMDGSNRITVTEILADPPICMCNVYMPARNSRCTQTYDDTLEELNEIISKYGDTHPIVIVGDMNASLKCRPGNEQDVKLKRFCDLNGLTSLQTGEATFFHENGKDNAEIDYILCSEKARNIVKTVIVEDVGQSVLNTSDHIGVTAVMKIQPRILRTTPIPQKTKPNWDKCDKRSYEQYIHEHLTPFKAPESEFEWTCVIGQFQSTIKEATRCSIPNYRPTRKQTTRKNKLWNDKISDAVKSCKDAWWKWRLAGKPTSTLHPTVKQRVTAKRQLKKEQRKLANAQKVDNLNNIMNHKDDSKKFHLLIRNQRKTRNTLTKSLTVNGEILENKEDVCKGWATHFQSLANHLSNEHFDPVMKNTFEDDVSHIQQICETSNIKTTPIKKSEVQYAIKRLNTNKAADTLDLTSEHLIYGGISVITFLCDLLNHIIKEKHVPAVLKEGLLSPVYKKGDSTNPSNYRGITVTSVILKVLEHILNKRHNTILDKTQSKLQKGFTAGQSSIDAALIVSESLAEARNTRKPVILTTLDAQKAFDVVHHNSLLRKLYLDNIQGDDWLLLQDMYTDLSSTVKWENALSDPIVIKQGVRQGGVLSTTHYKRFNNPLLRQIESTFNGATIGHISIPHVTCADDLALISHNPCEMQLMINSVEDFANRERYNINPTKSSVLLYRNSCSSKTNITDSKYYMFGNCLPIETQTTHLGIERIVNRNVDVDRKIATGRKAAYSLFGAGLHSGNGLKQSICGKLWSTEIIPRMIFGLETL